MRLPGAPQFQPVVSPQGQVIGVSGSFPTAPAPAVEFKPAELASVLGGLSPEDAQLFDKLAFFCRAEGSSDLTLRRIYEVLGRVFRP